MTRRSSATLSSSHRAIMERLLELPFPGRDEIRKQVDHAVVREIGDHDERSLQFDVEIDVKAPVSQRVPVEATAYDEDGVPIEALLHVVGGVIKELEILKADGSAIRRMPEAQEFQVQIR